MPLSRGGLGSAMLFAILCAGTTAGADEPTKQACVAANESAQDLQRAGKLVGARAQLRTCAEKACPRAVRQDCTDRLRAVEKALPTVVLLPKESAGGGDLTSAALAVDGAVVPDALDGTAIPVDPGSHTFTVTLAGRSPVSLRIDLKEGDAVRREVVLKAKPVSEGAGPGQPGAAPDGESPASASAVSEAPSDGARNRGVLRAAGWSAIGVGAAGVALGSIFGILGLEKMSSLSSACPTKNCQPTTAKQAADLQSDQGVAHSDGVAANIAFGVGIVGLGAGVAMLVVSAENRSPDAPIAPPPASSLRAHPWVGLGDVGVAGSFP